jgi:hypothetical protein
LDSAGDRDRRSLGCRDGSDGDVTSKTFDISPSLIDRGARSTRDLSDCDVLRCSGGDIMRRWRLSDRRCLPLLVSIFCYTCWC